MKVFLSILLYYTIKILLIKSTEDSFYGLELKALASRSSRNWRRFGIGG